MRTVLEDLRQGRRRLARSAGSTAVAVMTLALGLGAATVVFSVVDAVLLAPLPYAQAERIVIPWRQAPPGLNLGYSEIPWGGDAVHLFQRESRTFRHLAAFRSDAFTLNGAGEPVLLDGLRVSAGFFAALGVAPAVGRAFTAAEDQPGRENEVILSQRLWRERFGARPDVVGRAVRLNASAFTVVGVMPAGFGFPRAAEMPGSFAFPREAQLWVPLALPPGPSKPAEPSELALVGRLHAGVTQAQAQAEMDVFARRLEAQSFPKGQGWFNSRVVPLGQQLAGDTRLPLLLILAAVGVVLAIACSNVAGLLLTQSLARREELALRAALGARRGRILRQLLTESLALALAGGLLGLLLAAAGVRGVKVLAPQGIPRLAEVGLDWRVFAFALASTLASGLLCGLAPAMAATRGDLDALQQRGQRTGGTAGSPRLRNALLVSQMALALVLVVAAGLLTRTFVRLLGAETGVDPARVLTFQLSLPSSRYGDDERIVRFYHDARERLAALPGVQSAGIVAVIPLDGAPESTAIRIMDHPPVDPREKPFAAYTIASPGYFAAAGTPLLHGRDFLATDTGAAPPVAIVNGAMARKYWPGEDAVGKRLGLGSPRFPVMTVVGVVANVKHLSLREEPGPEMYVPYTQKPWPSMLTMQVVLRAAGHPAALAAGARAAIHALDPELPVARLATFQTIAERAMTRPRFAMLLFGAFGALAALLAGIGMYSVVSYAVTQRTPELGIRMALGAQRGRVLALVLGQGARLAALGLAVGLAAALAVTRVMASFLYGVDAADPLTFAAVSLLLAAVILFACYLPARRATLVDPMIALRGPGGRSSPSAR